MESDDDDAPEVRYVQDESDGDAEMSDEYKGERLPHARRQGLVI